MKMFKKRIIFIVILMLSCAGSQIRIPGDNRPLKFHLVVIHTNDFHGENFPALAKEAALIKKIRAEEENVIYLDAGDLFSRGEYQRIFYGELEFAVLNAIGCDAITLGNNELKAADSPESSRKYLFDRTKQAKFPVLAANVRMAGDKTLLPDVKQYAVLIINGIKIGLVGVVTARDKDFDLYNGFLVEDPIKTAGEIIPRAEEESDIVIALTHIGYNDDIRLAEADTGIQAIIGGDSHTVLNKPVKINGIPIVQAGDHGKYLGRLDLYFELNNGRYILKKFKGKLIPITEDLPEDPDIRLIIDDFLNSIRQKAA